MTTAVVETLAGLGYCADALRGEVVCCEFARLAVERHVYDLGPDLAGELWGLIRAESPWHPDNAKVAPASARGYWFDNEAAWYTINWIETKCHHSKGELGPNPLEQGSIGAYFTLAPHQEFQFAAVFGWKKASGYRRFRTWREYVARGGGKSTLSAGVGNYMLAGDGEPGAQCVSAATKQAQALFVWEEARNMVLQSPELQEEIEARANVLFSQGQFAKFTAVSAQYRKLDGDNVHFASIDETHAHENRGVYGVYDTALGKRKQSLIRESSTAGWNKTSVAYQNWKQLERILRGEIEDDTTFGIIFTLDDGDDPHDPANWVKANPNLGISVDYDDLERQSRQAQQDPNLLPDFLTKRMNMWVAADTQWMDMRKWAASADAPPIEEFTGWKCYAGLDLANRNDVTALRIRFVSGEQHYGYGRYWLPEDLVYQPRNEEQLKYAAWAHEGLFTLTPGEVTDYAAVIETLLWLFRTFDVVALGYDPWQAPPVMQQLIAKGIAEDRLVEVRPTVQNFSAPMKELRDEVLQGIYHHDGDPVMEWMVANCVCHRDVKDNIYPRKASDAQKIDGVVAELTALQLEMRQAGAQQHQWELDLQDGKGFSF